MTTDKLKAAFDDKAKYLTLTHPEFVTLTRALWTMPFGDLTKMHKEKAKEFGATSPSTVFIRAIIFARLVASQEGGGGRA